MRQITNTCLLTIISLLILIGCSTGSNSHNTPPTATNSVVLPNTYSAPVQLNTKFNSGQCQVKTVIGSRGAGIDRSINGIAHALFDHQMISPKVGTFYTQSWGREGEYSMCAEVPVSSNVMILENELNQILNNFTGTIRGVVTITSN